jgi:hypothetical protein
MPVFLSRQDKDNVPGANGYLVFFRGDNAFSFDNDKYLFELVCRFQLI